jgi:hypothetical protein
MIAALETDFRDFYDHWFAGSWQVPDVVFERRARGGMRRSAMLSWLEQLGLRVPAHGRVCELAPRLLDGYPAGMADILDVVVYLDEAAHAGEGKVRLSVTEALAQHPHAYASEFIPANQRGLGESLRYLRIGRRQFWLRYTSADDWRSNSGEVQVELLREERPADAPWAVPHPLFAVDFVPAGSAGLYAVDFNTAPQIGGTGVEEWMSGREVYDEVVAVLLNPPPGGVTGEPS